VHRADAKEIVMTSMTEPRAAPATVVGRPERVVLAADDSHGAIAAADWLADRAHRRALAVRIVVVEGHVRSGERSGSPHRIAQGVAWRMREYVAAGIPEAAAITVRVVQGDVPSGLRDAAQDGDLLVLGCNRSTLWQHLPLVSRSTRIAEEAVRPTVVVPASWRPGHGPVVAAVATRGGDALVDWAADEAAGSGRELLLVRGNILPWSIGMPAVPLPDIALLDEVDHRLLTRSADRARSAHPGLEVRTELDDDGFLPELIARGARADLLVVGTASGPRFGSAVRGALEQVPCAVVVVPNGKPS
jgi:nucleotide-binding universal stress UspA family protein